MKSWKKGDAVFVCPEGVGKIAKIKKAVKGIYIYTIELESGKMVPKCEYQLFHYDTD